MEPAFMTAMHRIIRVAIFLCLAAFKPVVSAQAAQAIFTLDDVFLVDGAQITGTFEWTYDDGDFEGGTGVFTWLEIPWTEYSFNDGNLDIIIESNQIEITGNGNYHDMGLDIRLVLASPLSPTESTSIDLTSSFFECCGNGFKDQPFSGGSISPGNGPNAISVTTDEMLTAFAICRNNSTGASVQLPGLGGVISWDCTAAGLTASSGDALLVGGLGVAECGPGGACNLGGAVRGMTGRIALCRNLTSGQTVSVNLAGTSWDCENAGFAAMTGDRILQFVIGTAGP